MWVFKQYLTGRAEAALQVRVTLLNSANLWYKVALESYNAIVRFLFKFYVTDNNITNLYIEVRNLWQGSMTPAEFSQEVWMKALSCHSVFDGKYLERLFVESVTYLIRQTLRQRRTKHQLPSLEDLAQREVSLLVLQKGTLQKVRMNTEQPKYFNANRNVKTGKRQVMNMKESLPP